MKENFVKTSVYVASQLKDRYGEQWINPRDNKDDDKNLWNPLFWKNKLFKNKLKKLKIMFKNSISFFSTLSFF